MEIQRNQQRQRYCISDGKTLLGTASKPHANLCKFTTYSAWHNDIPGELCQHSLRNENVAVGMFLQCKYVSETQAIVVVMMIYTCGLGFKTATW